MTIISEYGNRQQALIEISETEFIEVSAYVNQSHSFSLSTTDYEVEADVDVSDHIRKNPRLLDLEGLTSNYDVEDQSFLDGLKSSVSTIFKPGEYVDKANNTFVGFEEIYEKKIPVTIYTHYKTYESMVLTSFNGMETPNDPESLPFSAQFKQIRKVYDAFTEGINLAAAASRKAGEAQARAEEAKKAAEEAKEKEAAAQGKQTPRSWLNSILAFAAGA